MQQQTNITEPTVFSKVQLEKAGAWRKTAYIQQKALLKAGCPFANFFRHRKGEVEDGALACFL
jgi:hypothetical protein